MMYYIVYPFASTIYGDSFKEALKNFIKLNHTMNINRIIIKDQTNHMEANVNYYLQNGRNKVGINFYPIPYPDEIYSRNDYVTDGTNSLKIINTDINPPLRLNVNKVTIDSLVPISPLPLSPVSIPFVPTVIRLPNH